MREYYSGKKILVTGGAGFVGTALVRALINAAVHTLVVVDNFLSSERNNSVHGWNMKEGTALFEGSIADDAILRRLPPDLDYVFHLATYHGNQSSIANPIEDHTNNLFTTLKLFDYLKGHQNLTKVVYASAGCAAAAKVQGLEEPQATTEDAPLSLHHDSPYQISKIVGELYANFYHAQHQLPVVKARFQNVYGPGEILGAGQWRGTRATVWRNVVPTFVYRALKQMALQVENPSASRDLIYVEDIVRGLLLCGSRGAPGEVYNLASGVETSILELAILVNRMAQNPRALELPENHRTWDHSGRRFGSTAKSREQLGFEATTGLVEGIERTIQWTRENMPLIESCIQRHTEGADWWRNAVY